MYTNIKSREAKYKEENDALMSKVHQTLTKEAKSDTERDELMKLLAAKQQHANESLIQEQARLIESLRTRCDQYEKALSIRTGSIELQVKEYKDEITTLRAIVHRLSAELSSFQCKYPHESPSLQASLKVIYEINTLNFYYFLNFYFFYYRNSNYRRCQAPDRRRFGW